MKIKIVEGFENEFVVLAHQKAQRGILIDFMAFSEWSDTSSSCLFRVVCHNYKD
jgi:hypothetical protein